MGTRFFSRVKTKHEIQLAFLVCKETTLPAFIAVMMLVSFPSAPCPDIDIGDALPPPGDEVLHYLLKYPSVNGSNPIGAPPLQNKGLKHRALTPFFMVLPHTK